MVPKLDCAAGSSGDIIDNQNSKAQLQGLWIRISWCLCFCCMLPGLWSVDQSLEIIGQVQILFWCLNPCHSIFSDGESIVLFDNVSQCWPTERRGHAPRRSHLAHSLSVWNKFLRLRCPDTIALMWKQLSGLIVPRLKIWPLVKKRLLSQVPLTEWCW